MSAVHMCMRVSRHTLKGTGLSGSVIGLRKINFGS